MTRAGRALALAVTLAAFAPGAARAQVDLPDGFRDSLVVGGLDFPVGMAFLPDGRLLVTEQNQARIRLVVNGAFAATDPVATIPGVVGGGEQGLLGIAVDPGWPARPYVYVHYDREDASLIRIARFTVTGDLSFTGNGSLAIDPASRRDLIDDIPDQAGNHNGGTVRFGPDGRLYVSLGEDGFMPCAAQDSVSLRGVILRLDVSALPPTPGGPPPRATITPPDNPFVAHPDSNARLVCATGLRNPFRFFVDGVSGDLFIGDVGQSHWEEIDRVAAEALGPNFGWPWFEGPDPYSSCALGVGMFFREPIHWYDRTGVTAAVIGAIRYRLPASPARPATFPGVYDGNLFFSDYYSGFLRRLAGIRDRWVLSAPVAGQPSASNWGTGFRGVSDYALGPDGALWYCRQHSGGFGGFTGSIGLIAFDDSPPPPPTPRVALLPPYPSPSRGSVTVPFTLAADGRVELRVFDARGRGVRWLVAGDVAYGIVPHEVTWDGRTDRGERVGPGLYFARLRVGNTEVTRRFVFTP